MINATTKEFIEVVEQNIPNIWATCYPRHISTPTGYANPKVYAASLSGCATLWDQSELTMLPHVVCAMTSLKQAMLGVPTYFVHEQFAQAVANTKLPMDFRLSELKWPLEAMLFVLPDHFVYDYFHFYTPFLSICRCSADIHPTREEFAWATKRGWEVKAWNPVNNEVDRMLTHFPFYLEKDLPQDYSGGWPLNLDLSTMQSSEFYDATVYERSLHSAAFNARPLSPPVDAPTPDEETEFRLKMNAFAVKLLLAFAVRPHVVKPGGLLRPAKMKKSRQRSELWSPNLIGWEYVVKRSNGVSLGGTHASPRWHWRVGHFTNQFIGKRGEADFVAAESLPRNPKDGTIDWTQVTPQIQAAFRRNHKLCWLEPVLVGAAEEAS